MVHLLKLALQIVCWLVCAWPAIAQDRSLVISNQGADTIEWIYLSNKFDSAFVELLESEVIQPGQQVVVKFFAEDYCFFDFTFVYSDGREEYIVDVNTCEQKILAVD